MKKYNRILMWIDVFCILETMVLCAVMDDGIVVSILKICGMEKTKEKKDE